MTDLVTAWQNADSVERGVLTDRLLQFNDLSNAVRANIAARTAKAAKLGVSYEEILRRENEKISKANIKRLSAEKRGQGRA